MVWGTDVDRVGIRKGTLVRERGWYEEEPFDLYEGETLVHVGIREQSWYEGGTSGRWYEGLWYERVSVA